MPRLLALAALVGALVIDAALARVPQDAARPSDGAAASAMQSDEARERFAKLPDAEQRRVIELWRADVAAAKGAQDERVRRAIAGLPERAALDPAREPRWFDPAVHAPAQPIPRRLARDDEPVPKDLHRRIAARHPARDEQPAYTYDFGLGRVVRGERADEPLRLFANGLLGRHPDWDLAEAAIAGALDDGSQRAVLEAFGHAYTTRAGVVHAHVTLYDAWSSGLEAEMPDVDVLGIVHTVLGDRTRWVAPLPESAHRPLYEKLAEVFQPARRLRSLAVNTARAYLDADPVLGDGFVRSQGLFLHALWTDAAEEPAAARARLPSPQSPSWNAFAGLWTGRLKAEPELLAAARERIAALAADSDDVRARLIAALVAVEAERKDATPARSGR